MREKSSRELISAYFDGELSPTEVLEAERLLEQDAAARRLLEELETLHGCLSDLPPERVPLDLSQRVLQEAERRMLKSPEAAPARRDASSQGGGVSPIGWIGIGLTLAVAASLLLAFVLPGQLGDQLADRTPVAATPDDSPPATTATPPLVSDRFAKKGTGDIDADGTPAAGMKVSGGAELEKLEDGRAAGGFADKAASDFQRPSDAHFKMPAPTAPPTAATGQAASQPSLMVQQPADALGVLAAESTNSYVLDVPSEVAQNRVLERFEQVLSEQQISLEDNGTIAVQEVGESVAANESAQTRLAATKELEKSDRADESAPQNVDRVYVIDATPEQLSNTIVGFNRLAAESETPVQLRRLGTVDNTSTQSLHSTAGAMPGIAGSERNLSETNGVAASAPGFGSATPASGPVPQSASQRGGESATRKGADGAARAESAKKLAEPKPAELRQQTKASPTRGASEPAQVTKNNSASQLAADPKAAQSPVRSNVANLSDETQQRAIFIFRVVPAPASVSPAPASPAPAAQPARPEPPAEPAKQ